MSVNKDITLSIFFPAYYDEKNIGKVVEKAVSVCEEIDLKDYEITIIEDGSPDNTAKVADELAKKFPKVKVIHHKKKFRIWSYSMGRFQDSVFRLRFLFRWR